MRVSRKYLGYGILIILILFPLGVERVFSEFYLALLIRILLFGILMLGFELLMGYAGMVSFGHAMFYGVGAYTAALMMIHVSRSVWLMLAAAVISSALIGLFVGLLAIRTREIYFVFFTFAFAQFFYLLFNKIGFVGAADGLSIGTKPSFWPIPLDLGNRVVYYYFCLFMLVLAFFVARRIVMSPFGKVLVGIRENEDRIRFLGYDVHRTLRRVFLISGIFGGVAGALLVGEKSFVSTSVYHWMQSAEIILMELVGGAGTLVGPIIGAGFVIYLGDILSTQWPDTWRMFLGGIIIICVLFSPSGILGLIGTAGRWWKGYASSD
jgi:branched-chain amino acid transport system permease protein